MVDEASGHAYFHHAASGRSEWARPAEMGAPDQPGEVAQLGSALAGLSAAAESPLPPPPPDGV